MKKILYIIPIVVFAMVGLIEDAKAQTQTGNASNGVTGQILGGITGGTLVSTTTGSSDNAGGGNTVGVTSGTPAQAQQQDTPSNPAGGNGQGSLTDESVGEPIGPIPPGPGETTTVAPGATVTLTTAGWLPGEIITISYPDSFTLA